MPSLRALSDEGHDIEAVVTRPDRPAGRGRSSRSSPVRQAADAEGHRVLTPERPRDEAFIEEIRRLQPELSVVAAYGHSRPREILELPHHGSVNVHASLLPELRGAAPVNWAIIRGHERTGVTVMRMVEAMDAGPILLQRETPIGPGDSATILFDRLCELGAGALIEALTLMAAGGLEEREQDHARATYAPKLDRAAARVDWTLDAWEVACWIRGLDAVPGAWTLLDGDPVKLYDAEAHGDAPEEVAPGTVLEDPDGQGLVVTAGRGTVLVREVKPAGKRRMAAAEWLRGAGPQPGRRLE